MRAELEVLVGNAVLGVTHDLDSEVLDGERDAARPVHGRVDAKPIGGGGRR
jgi:hypothetical protein